MEATKRRSLIQMKDVTKKFGKGELETVVLKEINLTIHEGDFLMIVGKSGSGKTTLMNMIGFLDRLTTGTYSFLGEDVSLLNENKKSSIRNKHFGFAQNVELPLIYAGEVNKKDRLEAAEKYLSLVGIPEKIKAKTKELSGGQQQRVAIARALINEPLLIMADEPTGALDSDTGIGVMSLLRELNKQGKTIIMVTHDEDLLQYATRIIRMHDGSFVEEGAVR